jgi:acyl-CoA thioesterase
MPDTSFSTMLEAAKGASPTTPLKLTPDWMQGRAGFGGILGALALQSMRSHVPATRKVRSLLISFVGPVTAGDFAIHTQLLRSGKAVTQVQANLIQHGAVCCAALASFGGDRPSAVQVEPAPRPAMPAPDKALELPYIEGLTPSFTRHFVFRWALGELPFSGKGGCEIGGWIQFRERSDCLTEEWLVALADAWPTPVLSMLTAPAAASSLTWEMGFVHLDRPVCVENAWWCYRSTVDSAEQGYVHERGAIWDPQGRLAAFSRQTSTVFA